MEKGIVFNIQKFSIHDGPGIRTTVFLKGCPLQCAWCSNPESQSPKVQILYDKEKCRHCHTCINICPQKAIANDKGLIAIDATKCDGCLKCVQACPTKALSHEGELKSVAQVVATCLQDRDFYEESQGGVTISGGEGMAQPRYVKDLVDQLKKEKIHVAIETTGCVASATFKNLAPRFDLLLFDVKHHDSDKHRIGTGIGNELIVKNLQWALANSLETLCRIPVIPGFNDSHEDAMGIANLLISVQAKRVQLLPFHQFGEKKYELLTRDYALKNKKALHREDLAEYQQVFLDAGIECFF